MEQDYTVFVCNTKELAEEHGTYVSPDGGPFFATRSAGESGQDDDERNWRILVPHTEDGQYQHIVQDRLSLYLAMEFTDRLNAACRLWADIFRNGEWRKWTASSSS